MDEFDKIENEIKNSHKFKEKLISYKDFMAKELPEDRWIAEGLIPFGITILSSSPGQFKTFLLLELSKQIVEGKPAFGHFKTEKLNVLFINEECSERTFQDRLKIIKGTGENIYLTNLAGFKLNPANMTELLDICKEKKIGLVIFDSLTRIHDFQENDASSIKKVYEELLKLVENNISVIVTHHHRKATIFGQKNVADEMRGSTDLSAQVDCHIAIDIVAKDKSYLVIVQPKLRQAENLQDFRLDIIKKDTISFVYAGEFSPGDAQSLSVEANKDIVLEVIETKPGLSSDDIIEHFKGKIGQVIIKKIISKLSKDEVIYSETKKPRSWHLKEKIMTIF